MKVALISLHSFLKPGGVKRHILGLYQEYKKRGVNVKIIAPRRELSENYGKDVILLGTSFPVTFGGSQGDFVINFDPTAIERTLKREKFDILHFHNLGVPSGMQILTSPYTADTLNILTFHSNIEGSKFFQTFPFFIDLLNRVCRWKMDGVIGVAPIALSPFKKYHGLKALIPNGVDLEKFNPRGPKIKKFLDPERHRKINILFVGRIEERKGLIYLLKAFKILEKKYPDKIRLIVVGKGDLEGECRAFAKENNLSEVHFEGEKEEKELVSYYRSCDIFCSPAIFGESFGLVLIEAMACAKPVVGFANQGYYQLLKGKKGGKFLATPKDFKGLAVKLEHLIKSPSLRKEMGNWGLKESKKYSWKKVSGRVLAFYRFCQKNKKREPNNLSLEKMWKEISRFLSADISRWLE